ncbi:CRISP/Allergen/PR-1-like Protein [Tribolium castaneum]|uniref:CRISP/Allergen/PR-1-like Protein n=1 Tax=Tribolium castaneum TaxID=7070 RepID=D6WC11_TRICA|nr:PREDICTED: CRISP/Allergen/PR-1 [Tribolium castaneum]EEZ99142.2 CRISP/Allergen/PR-1-like Protein [Tribolium castaneum]|eukprot:XP_015837132.1 PREDICTED: CRISP/Allergen/PR-1 [Tribolium castaneum]
MSCGKVEHSACKCSRAGGREELDLKNITNFRKLLLDLHNEARNNVASGKETRGELTSASNMMAVSYSLELEYFARCYMRNRFTGRLEPGNCRVMSNGRKAGQCVIGSKGKQTDLSWVKKAFEQWMGQIQYIRKRYIDSYSLPSGGDGENGDFIEIMWAAVNEIGCARIYAKDIKKLKYIMPYETGLICNYGITISEDQNLSPNEPGRPVFKRGKPCSECPEFTKCNKEYTSLCGEIAPLPTGPAYDFDNTSKAMTNKLKRLTLLVVTFSFLVLL